MFATIRAALDALRLSHDRLAASLDRQTALEADRLVFAKQQWEADQAARAEAAAQLATAHAAASGTDLPAEVSAVVRQIAGEDRVLAAQLLQYARTRLMLEVPAATVAREIARGDSTRSL